MDVGAFAELFLSSSCEIFSTCQQYIKRATAGYVIARTCPLALREFALGIEALERFVRREPLRRVHECAFGVLALESEPVDPRL